MAIIAILDDGFCGGAKLANALSETLGFRQVTQSGLVQHAALSGVNLAESAAAVEDPPGILGRLGHGWYRHFYCFQSACAETIKKGDAVCSGLVSELLTESAPGIIRIGVIASYPARIRAVEQELGLDRSDAVKWLRELDRRSRRRKLYLLGAHDSAHGKPADLYVNLTQTSIDEACRIVSKFVAERADVDIHDPTLMEDFALSCRVKAELARNRETTHLDVQITVQQGTVTVRSKLRTEDELVALQRAVLGVPGIIGADFSGLQLGTEDSVIASSVRPGSGLRRVRRPAVALAGAGALIALSLVLIQVKPWLKWGWFSESVVSSRSFAGVITDSLCSGTHNGLEQNADCVRTCIKRPGVRYALYDGSRTYAITDATSAAPFAAQKVMVKGFLNQATGTLRIESIRSAAQ